MFEMKDSYVKKYLIQLQPPPPPKKQRNIFFAGVFEVKNENCLLE